VLRKLKIVVAVDLVTQLVKPPVKRSFGSLLVKAHLAALDYWDGGFGRLVSNFN